MEADFLSHIDHTPSPISRSGPSCSSCGIFARRQKDGNDGGRQSGPGSSYGYGIHVMIEKLSGHIIHYPRYVYWKPPVEYLQQGASSHRLLISPASVQFHCQSYDIIYDIFLSKGVCPSTLPREGHMAYLVILGV